MLKLVPLDSSFSWQVLKEEVQEVAFTIPVHEPLPSQYVIRVSSDRWLGSVSVASVALKDIILPELHAVHTGEQKQNEFQYELI